MLAFASLLGATDPLSSSADGLSKLVEQGGKSPLALAALAVVLTAFLALWFFKNAPLAVKLTIFSVLLVIGTTFGVAYYRQVFPHHHDTKPKPDAFANFDDQFQVILTASTSFFDPIRSHPVRSNDVPHIHAYAPTHWMDVFPKAYILQMDAEPDKSGKYAYAVYHAKTEGNLTFSEANKILQTVLAHLNACLTPELGWYDVWRELDPDGKEMQSALAQPELHIRWGLKKPDTVWSLNTGKKRDIESEAELKKEPSDSGDFIVSLELSFHFSDHPEGAKD